MPHIEPISAYKKRVEDVRHQLGQNNSDFAQWAKDNGYTINQVYATTRRDKPSKFGISREIAEKLGLLTGEHI